MATRGHTPDERRTAVNWRWILGCEIVGAGLIGLSFWLESRHRWQGVSENTLVSVGSALVLAGALFLVSRRFLRDVGDIASQAATTAADARIDASTQILQLRLDELSQRMTELLGRQDAVDDEAVRAMEVPSFDTVATALAVANRLGALKNGHVTVQGSHDPDELGLEFSWGRDMGDGRFAQAARYVLEVRTVLYDDFGRSGPKPWIVEEWGFGTTKEEDEPAEAVGLRLINQIRQRDRWKSPTTLDWPMALENLQRALELAVRSRHRPDGDDIVQGALKELVNDEWMITESGLECPSRGYLFAGDQFPEPDPPGPERRAERDAWLPVGPEWVDEVIWSRLVERGKRVFPIRRGPYRGMPSWVPCTESPAELRSNGEAHS
jgi:hypothetical protein